MFFLLLFFFLLFAYLVWRRLLYGLILIAALLPSCLIRFQIFGLPSTVLEGMILIVVIIWIIKHGRDWKKIISNIPACAGRQYLISNIKNKQWFAAIILFLVAASIAVFISPNPRAALGVWKAYFAEPILLFAVFISTIKTREDLNKVIWGLVLGALPVALFAILQKFTGWLIPNPFWQAEATRRVTSFFGYPNAVALYLAPIIPLMIYLLFQEIKNKTIKIFNIKYLILKTYLILNILISAMAIFFAHSTGAIVALTATACLFGLLNKKTRWWIAGLIVASTILLPLTPLKEPFQSEVLLGDRSGTVRLNMWAETMEMLKNNFIFGAGLSGYQEIVHPYHILNWAEIYLYPHNLFLNFWSETGLAGLIGFLWLVVLFCRDAINRVSTAGGWLAQCLLASMLIILIHGLVDVPYFKNDLAVMFWLLMGMVAVIVETRQCLVST